MNLSWFEPFTVLSLALPVSGNSTLKRLLHNYYEHTVITYKCPQCSKEGESCRKTIIQKMPLILVLHLNRFEYAISARKKQNFVDFPVEGLSLRAHILSDKPSATYSPSAVSNHFGTLSGGYCTSYCKPSCGNSLLVPMVRLHFWCEAWGGWGSAWCLWVGRNGGLMPGLWWGWWMAVLRQTDVGCRVLWSFPYTSRTLSVPVFSIPIRPVVSHNSRTPSCPLFPTITTLMHPRPDAKSCCFVSHPVAGC